MGPTRIADHIRERLRRGVICVTGLGASGKSVLSRKVQAALEDCVHVKFDDFYHPREKRRGMVDQDGATITGCHPFSFDRDKAVSVIRGLAAKHRYVIVDGLAAVHIEDEIKFDLLIYMDCDEDEERRRRIERDRQKPGHTMDDILGIFAERRRQYERYVLPCKERADVLVKSLPDYSVDIFFR
jgi:uridine kinase